MNEKATSPPPRRWLKPSTALNRFKPPPLSMQTTAPVERKTTRYGFRVGGICLLIRENTTSEVIEQPPIFRLPNTPVWLLGLVNLRGNLVPVYDIKQLFDLGTGEVRDKNRLLVLDQGDKAVSMTIDSLPQPASISQPLSRLPPLPAELLPHVTKAYAQDELIWLEFDHHAFFQSLSERITMT